MPAWREFEQLAAQIYEKLAPNSRVTFDAHIMGKSGVERQIDVSVKSDIAGHQLLMVVDAKNYGRPANIGEVDKFAGKLEDVGANKGILICKSGFTSGAENKARERGIDLCNVHDAQSRDWNLDIELPILWIERQPTIEFSMVVNFEGGDQFSHQQSQWIITEDGGETGIALLATFEKLWNERKIDTSAGPNRRIIFTQPNLQVRVKDKGGKLAWRDVENAHFIFSVSEEVWQGSFNPEECQGLLHYADGHFEPSYLPVGAIPTVRNDSWKRVEDPNKLAVEIPGTVVVTRQPIITELSAADADITIID